MNENTLDNITFSQKVSVMQQIVDTDTGEVLFEVESSVLFLTIKFFTLLLRNYFKFLRQSRNIQVFIRSYINVTSSPELDFSDDRQFDNTFCPF